MSEKNNKNDDDGDGEAEERKKRSDDDGFIGQSPLFRPPLICLLVNDVCQLRMTDRAEISIFSTLLYEYFWYESAGRLYVEKTQSST